MTRQSLSRFKPSDGLYDLAPQAGARPGEGPKPGPSGGGAATPQTAGPLAPHAGPPPSRQGSHPLTPSAWGGAEVTSLYLDLTHLGGIAVNTHS